MATYGMTKELVRRRSKLLAFFDGIGRALDIGFTQMPKLRRAKPVGEPVAPASLEGVRRKAKQIGILRSSTPASADALAFESDWARISGDFARVTAPLRHAR